MGIKDEVAAASGELQGAVDQAKGALQQLVNAGEEALQAIEDKVLSTTIGDAIEAGKAAIAKLTS